MFLSGFDLDIIRVYFNNNCIWFAIDNQIFYLFIYFFIIFYFLVGEVGVYKFYPFKYWTGEKITGMIPT
jgi:hypothetical protein